MKLILIANFTEAVFARNVVYELVKSFFRKIALHTLAYIFLADKN